MAGNSARLVPYPINVRHRFDLSWPFALVGALIGIPVAAGLETVGAWTIAGVITAALWMIGRRATRTGHRGWFAHLLLLTLLTGALLERSAHVPSGVWSVCALLGMVAALHLGAFALGARQTGRARAGSLAARGEAWFAWAAGLLSLDLWVWIGAGLSLHQGPRPLALALIAASIATKGAFLIATAWLLHRMTRLGDAASALPEQAEPVALSYGAVVEDFGIGDQARGTASFVELSYRERPPLDRLIRGDGVLAHAAVRKLLSDYLRLLVILYGVPLGLALLSVLDHS
jgi:hypothetical protein